MRVLTESEITEAILNVLRSERAAFSVNKIASETMISAGTVRAYIAEMVRRGEVAQATRGYYRLSSGRASIEDQRSEARQWAQWFREAGYEIYFTHTGQPEPFDRQWQVWTPGGDGQRLATIDIDGCGASWHGDDDLWLTVVGSKVGVTR